MSHSAQRPTAHKYTVPDTTRGLAFLGSSLQASLGYVHRRAGIRAKSLIKRYRDKGLIALLARLIAYPFSSYKRRKQEAFIDKDLGVETRGSMDLLCLRVPFDSFRYATGYAPSDPYVVRDLLRELRRDFSTFTFVDLGCGKGRALVIAGEFRFQRLIGVEFAPSLVHVAEQNCRRLGLPAQILLLDAMQFNFPGGNVVVYLYNPFGPQVLRAVIERLLAAATEECFVIYVNPQHGDLLDKCPRMKRVATDLPAAIWRLAPAVVPAACAVSDSPSGIEPREQAQTADDRQAC